MALLNTMAETTAPHRFSWLPKAESVPDHERDPSSDDQVKIFSDLADSLRAEELLEFETVRELVAPALLAVLTPREAATHLLRFGTIDYAQRHVSGVSDQATAYHNVHDTANGQAAKRSAYQNAPGGSVRLSGTMLRAMLALARDGWRFKVSEFAGGSHSPNSRHYRGTAVDVERIGTLPVSSAHPSFRRFMQACRTYGAVELLGPGDANHDTHVHAAWPD